jgi:hypothetical protein
VFGDYCSQTRQFVPTGKKTLPDAKLRMTRERTTCGLRLNRYMEKNETLNERRFLDEKERMNISDET